MAQLLQICQLHNQSRKAPISPDLKGSLLDWDLVTVWPLNPSNMLLEPTWDDVCFGTYVLLEQPIEDGWTMVIKGMHMNSSNTVAFDHVYALMHWVAASW